MIVFPFFYLSSDFQVLDNESTLEYTLALEQLAKQQHKLLEAITKTEGLLQKVKTKAGITSKDINVVKGSITQWSSELETL